MDPIELQAEVFKIIRKNQDKPKRSVIAAIKEHLPDEKWEDICFALSELLKRGMDD